MGEADGPRSGSSWFDRVSDLEEDPELLEPPPTILPKIAYRGRITILSGRPKIGKSTVIGDAVASFSTGTPFLDEPCGPGETVWLHLEEPRADVLARFAALDGDPTRLVVTRGRPPHGPPGPATDLLKELRLQLEAEPSDLVVVDSLTAFAKLTRPNGRVPDDGDNAGWADVLFPLEELARDFDVAVLIIHHARRSDGHARGAGAIFATPDVLLEFHTRPPSAAPTKTNRRKLEVTGSRRGLGKSVDLVLEGNRYRMDDGTSDDPSDELPLKERVYLAIKAAPGIGSGALREAVKGEGTGGTGIDEAARELIAEGRVEDRGSRNRRRYSVVD